MSLFLKGFNARQIANIYEVLRVTQVRNAHQWYPDLKPGPYPKTKEEREAAAKKYNLLPEEYEPYPEETDQSVGDYPKLPFRSVDSKDPWYPWDNEDLRKDYGEPVHTRIMNLLPEFLSTDPPHISHEKGTCIFLGIVAFFLSFFFLLESIKIVPPVMEHQLVTADVKHYTFDVEKKH